MLEVLTQQLRAFSYSGYYSFRLHGPYYRLPSFMLRFAQRFSAFSVSKVQLVGICCSCIFRLRSEGGVKLRP